MTLQAQGFWLASWSAIQCGHARSHALCKLTIHCKRRMLGCWTLASWPPATNRLCSSRKKIAQARSVCSGILHPALHHACRLASWQVRPMLLLAEHLLQTILRGI